MAGQRRRASTRRYTDRLGVSFEPVSSEIDLKFCLGNRMGRGLRGFWPRCSTKPEAQLSLNLWRVHRKLLFHYHQVGAVFKERGRSGPWDGFCPLRIRRYVLFVLFDAAGRMWPLPVPYLSSFLKLHDGVLNEVSHYTRFLFYLQAFSKHTHTVQKGRQGEKEAYTPLPR